MGGREGCEGRGVEGGREGGEGRGGRLREGGREGRGGREGGEVVSMIGMSATY